MIQSAEGKKIAPEEIEKVLLRDYLVHATAPRKNQVAICIIPEEQKIRVYLNIFQSKDFSRSLENDETKKAIEHFLELVKENDLG